MKIRDRIKELRRVPAGDLVPNPKNWRAHPLRQQDALKGILAEVGYADALLARELEDGSLMLVDGHLRAEVAADQLVPVLVLDVSAEEADKLLLTHDTITGLAEIDREKVLDLMETTALESEALMEMLQEMIIPLDEPEKPDRAGKQEPDKEIPEVYQIIVSCRDAEQQERLYEEFVAQGFPCRLMNL